MLLGDIKNTHASGGAAASNWNLIGNPYAAYVALNDNATGHDGDANNDGDWETQMIMPTLIFLRKIADRYTTHTSMYTHGMDHLGISTASIVQMLNTSHQAKDFLFI